MGLVDLSEKEQVNKTEQHGREFYEEIGLEGDWFPEVRRSWTSDEPYDSDYGFEGVMGADGSYESITGRVIINQMSEKDPEFLGPHEFEHRRQIQLSHPDLAIKNPHRHLEKVDLLEPENSEQPFHPLLKSLKELGFSPDLMGGLISRNEEFEEEIKYLTEEYEEPEVGRDRETIYEACRLLESEASETEIGTYRLESGPLRAEREGFAWFVTLKASDIGLDAIEETIETTRSYSRNIAGTSQNVGEKATERVEELEKIYENLTERHMGNDEAIKFILDEVQPRKLEHATTKVEEYGKPDELVLQS